MGNARRPGEEGESIRDAAIRETLEESGIEIEITGFCGIYQNVSRGICNTLFTGKPVGGAPTPCEEALEVGFFPLPDALEMVSNGELPGTDREVPGSGKPAVLCGV